MSSSFSIILRSKLSSNLIISYNHRKNQYILLLFYPITRFFCRFCARFILQVISTTNPERSANFPYWQTFLDSLFQDGVLLKSFRVATFLLGVLALHFSDLPQCCHLSLHKSSWKKVLSSRKILGIAPLPLSHTIAILETRCQHNTTPEKNHFSDSAGNIHTLRLLPPYSPPQRPLDE